MRGAIQEYFGPAAPFIKTREPAWLGGLELDCYNEEKRLAFEYQGIQHYEFVSFFHNGDINNLIAQQDRDVRKQLATIDEEVALIEVPYTIRHADIRSHVRLELDLLGYVAVCDPAPYDEFIQAIRENDTLAKAMLAKAREIARSHGGECLSEVYIDCHELLKFRCKKNHVVFMALADVNHASHKRPRFCYDCGGTRRRTFAENKADVEAAGYGLLSVRTIVRTKKPITQLLVTCPKGLHTYWVDRPNFLPLNAANEPVRNCRSCARIRARYEKGLASCNLMCQKFDLEALTPYVGLHDRMNWKCLKCGNLIINKSCNTMNGRKGGKCQACKGKTERT